MDINNLLKLIFTILLSIVYFFPDQKTDIERLTRIVLIGILGILTIL